MVWGGVHRDHAMLYCWGLRGGIGCAADVLALPARLSPKMVVSLRNVRGLQVGCHLK